MSEEDVIQKLAAVLYADVAGYSRLTEADEIGTHRQLSVSLDLMAERICNSGGRVIHYAGDALLASFESVVAAANCAIGIQRALNSQWADLPGDKRLLFRIGINLGEVIIDRDDIYGDGVNVAARLESLAEPGGICVSASVHEQVNDKIDARFQDMGEQNLKNIKRPVKAYRVVMSSRSPDDDDASYETMAKLSGFPQLVARSTDEEEDVGHLEMGPASIMILPFKSLGRDAESEGIVDGFRLSIQSMLVKLSGLFLVNAPIAETYRNRDVSAIQAGNEIGIRYVLDGAVQMTNGRIRVTVQLTDAPAARVIWADRYDRLLHDIFELQDEITTQVTVALEVTLASGGVNWWEKLGSWQAQQCVLRGLSHLYQGLSKGSAEDNALARQMFEEVEKMLPEHPQALGQQALTHWLDAFQNWSEDPEQSIERATELAQRAVELDDPDGFGHVLLGHVRLFQRRHDEAYSLCEKSIARRPSCPLAHGIFADVLHYCGQPERAIKQIKRAARHERIHVPWMAKVLAESYRDTGKILPSITIAEESLRLHPGDLSGYVTLCTNYSLLNRPRDARRIAQEILNTDPSFSIGRYLESQPYRDSAKLDLLLGALREAGLPT